MKDKPKDKVVKIKEGWNSDLKKIFRTLAVFSTRVPIVFKPKGVEIRVMTLSGTTFIKIEIPKKQFESYECKEEMTIVADLEKLNDRLKAFSYDFVMDINENTITLKNERYNFVVCNLEGDYYKSAEYPEITTELKREFKFTSEADFKKDLMNLNRVGETAEFNTQEAELVIQVAGGSKTEYAEIKPKITDNKETINGHKKFENAHSRYDLEIMRNLMKFGGLNSIKFGDNSPCVMNFDSGSMKIEGILAPRIEMEDNEWTYQDTIEEEMEA